MLIVAVVITASPPQKKPHPVRPVAATIASIAKTLAAAANATAIATNAANGTAPFASTTPIYCINSSAICCSRCTTGLSSKS
jgi:hypothetical protein